MTIHNQQIKPRIIIEIKKAGAPANIWPRELSDLCGKRNIGKIIISVVSIESVVFVDKVCDEDRKSPGVKIITNGHAHAALFRSITAHRGTGLESYIGKFISIVAV